MNYLDPDEAPWTPEYQDKVTYLNRHRTMSEDELLLELIDDEHEKQLLHHT